MRNDARPIGEDSPASPIGGDVSHGADDRDNRDPHKHDRQSHIVNEQAKERQPGEGNDPVMPSNDCSMRTRV